MRKPDAGNLHVRFDEGEGTQRSLAYQPFIPCVPLYWLARLAGLSIHRQLLRFCGLSDCGNSSFNLSLKMV